MAIHSFTFSKWLRSLVVVLVFGKGAASPKLGGHEFRLTMECWQVKPLIYYVVLHRGPRPHRCHWSTSLAHRTEECVATDVCMFMTICLEMPSHLGDKTFRKHLILASRMHCLFRLLFSSWTDTFLACFIEIIIHEYCSLCWSVEARGTRSCIRVYGSGALVWNIEKAM